VVALAELGGHGGHLPGQLPGPHGALHLHQQLFFFEGLLDVVVGPETHGVHRALDGAVGRHDDDLGQRRHLTRAPQHRDAIGGAHLEVGQDQIVGLLGDPLAGDVPVLGLVHVVLRAAQKHRERGPHIALIVDDENLGHPARSICRALRDDNL
jgi:hypothetical protein